jgi:DNA-directed RNA polymerase alpha subunit
MLLDYLRLPLSATLTLKRKGIREMRDLQTISKEELESYNGVGRRSVLSLCQEMERLGLRFKTNTKANR